MSVLSAQHPFALGLSKGEAAPVSWFDKLTTNGEV
jgi:hypothetical protein